MLHEQINYDDDGQYIIRELSRDETELGFTEIETSLLKQGFMYRELDMDGNSADTIKLANHDRSIEIEYSFKTDKATLNLTELSPTREKVLAEALSEGHRESAFGVHELYFNEESDLPNTYQFGTNEYLEKIEQELGNR